MQCTLLVPHLLLPGGFGEEACGVLALDELLKFLARSSRQVFPAIGIETWLCQAFEVEKQQDWPIAPLTLALDGGDPGNAYWLRADPVHLRLRRDQLLLADSSAFGLSQQEAAQFISTLNRHFAQDGLQFLAPHPARWYLRLEHRPEMATHALSEVIGADMNACLPTGKDAVRWHRISNEIQMLLHQHPLNEAREAKGEMPVNSVWLWGGGTRPAVPGRHFSAVWSNEALACALAAIAGFPAAPLPDDAGRWLQTIDMPHPGNAHPLLVLGQLSAAAQYGDIPRWREEISALNRNWFAPLLKALRQRRFSKIALVVPGDRDCQRFELSPADLLKFWRRAKPLPSYAPARAAS
ncbi:MAG: hypothetical protein K2Y16_04890 [Burkholderiales bacterium]|nr:hypothetical protein [Burkholderiales bacterium]